MKDFFHSLFSKHVTQPEKHAPADGDGYVPTSLHSIPIPSKDWTYVEKEQFMVDHMTEADIAQFTSMPYDLSNVKLLKFSGENTHPFAYIYLNSANQEIAKSHIQTLNAILRRTKGFFVPKEFLINASSIAFTKYSTSYDCTKLLCTPYSFTGSISRFPFCLQFQSKFTVDSYQVVGHIYYLDTGIIGKADVHVWRRRDYNSPSTGIGYFFQFDGENLILYKAVNPAQFDDTGRPSIVYKSPPLIKWELQRAQEEADFKWLQENFLDRCPKSLTGYRRMKAMNTKNFQTLQSLAACLGRKI